MKSYSGILLVVSAALTFPGCANIGPPEPPSLELPKPPTDLSAARKGNRVLLTWTVPSLTTDRQRVRSLGPTRICRGLDPQLSNCSALAEAIPSTTGQPRAKVRASYTDILPDTLISDDPARKITYAVEVQNPAGRAAGLSNQVRVSVIGTLLPPTNVAARLTGQGVTLEWARQPSTPPVGVRFVDRVYRRQEGGDQSIVAAELPIDGETRFTFTDSNIEWQKTYEYRVGAATAIPQQNGPPLEVAGADSPELKVFADDTFPPAVPSSVQAVYSGPGQPPFIDLIWAPDADFDLAGYNVYRHEEGAEPKKLNSELLKIPAYRDRQVTSGETYFYSVSAVDLRSNESARSEEVSEAVP